VACSKVAVALSGGLDSAVSAALLQKQGYEIFGVTMDLCKAGCISVVEDACKVASLLRIPHHVVDFSDDFEERVVTPLCHGYASGETPNPCVSCNRDLKFGLLLNHIKKLGADYLATGHYARIINVETGHALCKAIDPIKDQTYFLYTLKSSVLASLLFPVGRFLKCEVAKMAEDFGLPVSPDRESHDICFMAGNNYRTFLKKRISTSTGKIYDIKGREVGEHSGISNYTIGQRQGINLGQSERLYVISIDPQTNSLVVGPESCLFTNTLNAGDLTWISGFPPDDNLQLKAKIRYQAPESTVKLLPGVGCIQVIFDTPVKAPAPGQSIVFFNGDRVLGGGIIRS